MDELFLRGRKIKSVGTEIYPNNSEIFHSCFYRAQYCMRNWRVFLYS